MLIEYYHGQNFWIEAGSHSEPVYPFNDQVLEEAEDLLKVKLPRELIQLMEIRNGGSLAYPNFVLPDKGEKDSLPGIYPIHMMNDDLSMLSLREAFHEAALPEGMVPLWSDYHNWIVLDYRHTKKDPPVLKVTENYTDHSWIYTEIAPAFNKFLKMLFRTDKGKETVK
ncbi:SMI1/KNR4 family protein [Metabacillus sp. 113a]|uniref:SMI1/KNR4 family protein n=1 Tax=Metabacillus sp. 113a TaxID=3404706 RepID=UPI003CFAF4B0